jgi:hypothetical protein
VNRNDEASYDKFAHHIPGQMDIAVGLSSTSAVSRETPAQEQQSSVGTITAGVPSKLSWEVRAKFPKQQICMVGSVVRFSITQQL